MTDTVEPVSQASIRTKCAVPHQTAMKWLRTMFPELAEDAKIEVASLSWSGGESVEFTVLHTVQKPVPGICSPIELKPVVPELSPPPDEPEADDIPF